MKTPNDQVDLTIPLLSEMELAASRTAAAVAEFMALDSNKVEEVRMALIEACINAIEHSRSADDKIRITFIIHEDYLEIRIVNRGKGFDMKDIRHRMAERTSEVRLLKRGWGMTLMQALMDHVEIATGKNGTVIRMLKKR